ncbi:MAG: DUF2344 domain-containing protein [Phycisphaerales bacterium]|nr:MAG: DUF2344 domain-containing protein [Phycisphaerales bacterium]
MSLEVANDNPQTLSGGSADVGEVTDATAVVRFAIGETLRFLSHAETMRLWERACVRAEMPIKYTQGFNPHAKLSLPLPRTVGVAADDERLLVRLFEAGGLPLGAGETETEARRLWQEAMQARLAAGLVPGLIVHEVLLARSSISFHPVSAQYVFALAQTTGLHDKIAGVLGQECLVVDRVSPRRPGGRRVDVRPFLKSIRLDGTQAIVECSISDAGSIRVDEIMTLLNIGPADLVAPIRRTHVTWKIT